MRYDPDTYVRAAPWESRVGPAGQRRVSPLQPKDLDGARTRQTAELDIWEDEGGSTAGVALDVRRGSLARRHFDELSD